MDVYIYSVHMHVCIHATCTACRMALMYNVLQNCCGYHRHLLYNEQYSQKVGFSLISCTIYFDHEMQMT